MDTKLNAARLLETEASELLRVELRITQDEVRTIFNALMDSHDTLRKCLDYFQDKEDWSIEGDGHADGNIEGHLASDIRMLLGRQPRPKALAR